MTKRRTPVVGRGGFTLAEMLVAMALLAILAAIVVPSVLSQVGKGEATRAANDLKTISEAAKTLYADVSRFPGSLSDLVSKPLSTAVAWPHGTWGTTAVANWQGPYLDKAGFDGSTPLVTGGGGSISTTITRSTDNNYLQVTVDGLSEDNKKRVDIMLDGAAGEGAGNVTYASGTALVYKLVRIQ